MLNGKLKSELDSLWLDFHSGGITNPLTVIEQISFLMFTRLLDVVETRNMKKAKMLRLTDPDAPVPPSIFSPGLQHLRWSNLIHVHAEELLRRLNGTPTELEIQTQDREDPWMNLFQFFRTGLSQNAGAGVSALAGFFRDSQCMINKPTLAQKAVSTIDSLPILEGDTKGDLYEYLLSKLSTAGVAGQFRTPRHIIQAMVQIADPQPTEKVCDPACGTGGFLTASVDHLRKVFTSPELKYQETDDAGEPVFDDRKQPVYVYAGDLLTPYREHMNSRMFHGFDFDATMLRIAAMNMLLHNIESPCIQYHDSLSAQSDVFSRFENTFDVVLANPPFKGSIDGENVHKGLTAVVKTKKTELLFLVLMEQILRLGGRCAVIVPDGVLFGSSTAHQTVRRRLLENNQMEAVISLPSGVFKPYAGVSTAILVFTKGSQTENVFFYKVEADGYSLDDKRTPLPESDLPDLLERWAEWKKHLDSENSASIPDAFADRKTKCFCIPKEEIAQNAYDLSINKYQEIEYIPEDYPAPAEIIEKLRSLEIQIQNGLEELAQLLAAEQNKD